MAEIKQHAVQAIFLMLAATFFMSTMDVAIKLLVEDYSTFQVVFLRCAVSWPLYLIWILATGRSQFKTAYPVGHLLRGLLGVLLLFAVGECFREMHLADAYTIFFAAPLLITLLSGPILGEPAGRFRILSCVIGFSGVLIVLQPSGDGWISYGALMGVVGMVAYSFTSLLLRSLGNRDGTVTIVFWFVTIVGLVTGLLAIPDWKPIAREHWVSFAILALSGTFGQILLTAAFRRASVAIVAPLDYTHMVWAVIYGFLLWGYFPGWRVWVGSGIIVLSGIFILFRENRQRQKLARILTDEVS